MNGRILLCCHANSGCTEKTICAALGVRVSDLFITTNGHARAPDAPRQVAWYDYCDEQGHLLYQVVRFEPKDFRVRRPDGRGGWTWGLNNVRRVLYRLPEALACQDLILVTEGEKDVEAARRIDLVATCNPFGAGKWCDQYSEMLVGKLVAIIADADAAGRAHAHSVAESLADKAVGVKALELPEAKDLAEWVERGGTRQALMELIGNTREWRASTIQAEAAPETHAPNVTPMRAEKRKCHADRHLKAGPCVLLGYAQRVSHKSGVFFGSVLGTAHELDVSTSSIVKWIRVLVKAGWFKRIDKGPRRKRNRATGMYLSIRYHVLDHETWVREHPGQCRPFYKEGDSPVSESETSE